MQYTTMFDSRKTMHRFSNLSNSLEGTKKSNFSKKLTELFDKKIVSEDGEFDNFKVTEKDVETAFAEIQNDNRIKWCTGGRCYKCNREVDEYATGCPFCSYSFCD
jgi:hypothetical protein